MLKENEFFYKRLHFLGDLFLTILALYLSLFMCSQNQIVESNFIRELLLFVLPIWSFFFLTDRKTYKYRQIPLPRIFLNLLSPFLKSISLLTFVLFAANSLNQSLKVIALFAGVDLLTLAVLRGGIKLFLKVKYHNGNHLSNILIVGTGSLAREFIQKVKENKDWRFKISGLLDWEERKKGEFISGEQVIGTLKDLPRIIKNSHLDYIVYAVPRRFLNQIEEGLNVCEKMGVSTCILADYFPNGLCKQKVLTLEEKPLIIFSSGPKKDELIIAKEILDRALSFIMIILLSPVFLFSALGVKISSKGPLLFKQLRVGLNGKKFILYKFRTMVENAEELKQDLLGKNEMDGPVFKIKEDPRITRMGRLLRKASLDELPQLFNVLKGDMSLVGPRPPLPIEVSNYDLWHRRKLCMKPGLTCLWQVNGRNKINFEKWMKLDLEYIDNWSLLLDFKILLKTIPAVLSGSGV
ncbi:MAG TPA: sugar transferase [Terriglobales bacterium]|nr:sugar transferase [Terriglobales bacterium]